MDATYVALSVLRVYREVEQGGVGLKENGSGVGSCKGSIAARRNCVGRSIVLGIIHTSLVKFLKKTLRAAVLEPSHPLHGRARVIDFPCCLNTRDSTRTFYTSPQLLASIRTRFASQTVARLK